jgi:hypothetical protein
MRKSLMSIPTLLTVLVIAGVIALIPLSPLPISASSDSDESETNADQRLKQKNLGSGESDNFNCGENLIDSAVSTICSAEPTPLTPPPPETATLSVCKELSDSSALGVEPDDFVFTVIGNNPSPAQFLGSADCVDVTIGPGEYEVSEDFVLSGFALTFSVDPTSDCMGVFGGIAIGVIQAGETQKCTFINQVFD